MTVRAADALASESFGSLEGLGAARAVNGDCHSLSPMTKIVSTCEEPNARAPAAAALSGNMLPRTWLGHKFASGPACYGLLAFNHARSNRARTILV